MQDFSLAVWLIAIVLEALLIYRARQTGSLSRFRLFYSYIAYFLIGNAILLPTYWIQPRSYATVYWYFFLISLLAEFAVLVEISDRMFEPYPAVRGLGRSLTLVILALFSFAYILPSLFRPEPGSLAMLDFVVKVSLTKGVIIAALFLGAHHYRLTVGRNVAGLMLGFAIYVGIDLVNHAVAQQFGKGLVTNLFQLVNPLGFTLCLLVWTASLWRYDAMIQTAGKPDAPRQTATQELNYQLATFDSTLARLLRR